jgi:UDP-N-acetylmuramate--alanine ligase
MSTSQIQNSKFKIQNSERCHFIGIGGAGMSALAMALLDLGASVSGSDMAASDATQELEACGARIYIGHNADNLGDATRVVVTAALSPDNPELIAAQGRGVPIVKRAALLGELMDLRRGVAVAGTHGKTTTSAMIAWVLSKAGCEPSYMVGGTIRGLGSGGHWGSGEVLVAEADEYDRSFLHLRPDVAIITNIESDHLEYYGSEEAIDEAFLSFARNVRTGGLLLLYDDDPRIASLASKLTAEQAPYRIQFYGTRDGSIWQACDVEANERGGTSYVVCCQQEDEAEVTLQVPGRHNALNSLAALAACVEVGVLADDAARLLGEFVGAGRRFEVKGEADRVTVVDDYAHHPTEISATLQAARQRYPGKRIVVLFQPHTYTRTRDFLGDFATSLSAADRILVTEIYASRERDTLGVSGSHIVEKIDPTKATFVHDFDEATAVLNKELRPNDVLLTMGAGDVWKVGETLLASLLAEHPQQK